MSLMSLQVMSLKERHKCNILFVAGLARRDPDALSATKRFGLICAE